MPGKQTVAGKARTGPLKEKTQITIRIDTQLMTHVYAQMAEDGARITDMVERGLILALAEARHELPAWTKQVRFVLVNATTKQIELIRGLAIAMVEHEVAKLSDEAAAIFRFCECFLRGRNSLPHAAKCLELYRRVTKRGVA